MEMGISIWQIAFLLAWVNPVNGAIFTIALWIVIIEQYSRL